MYELKLQTIEKSRLVNVSREKRRRQTHHLLMWLSMGYV